MLARTYRLRKNSDFQRLYKSGKRFTTPSLVLYFAPSSLGYSQFAMVVSKKVAKSAVTRNALRRRVSAILEENFSKVSRPTKAIILIRRDFSSITPAELKKEVLELLSKVM